MRTPGCDCARPGRWSKCGPLASCCLLPTPRVPPDSSRVRRQLQAHPSDPPARQRARLGGQTRATGQPGPAGESRRPGGVVASLRGRLNSSLGAEGDGAPPLPRMGAEGDGAPPLRQLSQVGKGPPFDRPESKFVARDCGSRFPFPLLGCLNSCHVQNVTVLAPSPWPRLRLRRAPPPPARRWGVVGHRVGGDHDRIRCRGAPDEGTLDRGRPAGL